MGIPIGKPTIILTESPERGGLSPPCVTQKHKGKYIALHHLFGEVVKEPGIAPPLEPFGPPKILTICPVAGGLPPLPLIIAIAFVDDNFSVHDEEMAAGTTAPATAIVKSKFNINSHLFSLSVLFSLFCFQ